MTDHEKYELSRRVVNESQFTEMMALEALASAAVRTGEPALPLAERRLDAIERVFTAVRRAPTYDNWSDDAIRQAVAIYIHQAENSWEWGCGR